MTVSVFIALCRNAEIPFQYYLRNVCYPLLNYHINGIDNRFDKYGSTAHLMHRLISSVIVERDVKLKDIIELYQDDLPMAINTEEDHCLGSDENLRR